MPLANITSYKLVLIRSLMISPIVSLIASATNDVAEVNQRVSMLNIGGMLGCIS